jgi:hypothetical protein
MVLASAPVSSPSHSYYPIESVTYYGGGSMVDHETGDANADDQDSGESDCADCSAVAPTSVDPPAQAMAASAGCANGDAACVPDGQDSENSRDENESAPPADF